MHHTQYIERKRKRGGGGEEREIEREGERERGREREREREREGERERERWREGERERACTVLKLESDSTVGLYIVNVLSITSYHITHHLFLHLYLWGQSTRTMPAV